MEHVELDGLRIEYELLDGAMPVVVLPHARPFVGWYSPLASALDRAALRYRRSVPRDRPWCVEDDAALCARLLTHLGIERPHVVGHSYGGLVALELARDHGVEPRSVAAHRTGERRAASPGRRSTANVDAAAGGAFGRACGHDHVPAVGVR